MQLNIGDKVRFLNETGEGIISAIVDKYTVKVRIEDGFDIPYPIDQLVTAEIPKPEQKPEKTITSQPEPEQTTYQYKKELATNFEEGIYILLSPHTTQTAIEADLNLFIVNHTSYNVLYSIAQKSFGNTFISLNAGELKSNKSQAISSVSRENLNTFGDLKVDIIFFGEQEYKALPPVSEFLKINPVRLYKETNFIINPFVSGKAFIVPVFVVENEERNAEMLRNIDPEQLMHAMLSKDKSTNSKAISKPHSLGMQEIEVDLHIEELIDNHKGMSNGQIIDVQLRHFQSELDKAIHSNVVKKITFIHGVGSGRLKQEIIEILKNRSELRFHDASYSKYGFGATEVVLK